MAGLLLSSSEVAKGGTRRQKYLPWGAFPLRILTYLGVLSVHPTLILQCLFIPRLFNLKGGCDKWPDSGGTFWRLKIWVYSLIPSKNSLNHYDKLNCPMWCTHLKKFGFKVEFLSWKSAWGVKSPEFNFGYNFAMRWVRTILRPRLLYKYPPIVL